MQFTLIIEDINGMIADEMTFEQGSFTIGRTDDNDIQLSSRSVSRHHARLFTDRNRAFIEDLNSSNGVVVDGQRIQSITHLVSGSQIRVGDFLLILKSSKSSAVHGVEASKPERAIDFPRLIRIGDEREGEVYAITQTDNSIGRIDENAIALADTSVSRHHVRLVMDQGQWVLVDLGSSNGTRINGQLINEPTLVSYGDLLAIGNVRLILVAPGQLVNLVEFRRMYGRSSRGLIIAVTILALMLVFVGSSIGAFIIIDRQAAEQQAAQSSSPQQTEPVLTPEERASQLRAQGDAHTQAERWNEAIAMYTQALGVLPDCPQSHAAINLAQGELNALQVMQAADLNISNANEMVRQGNPADAIIMFDRAREQLSTVSAESVYHQLVQDRINLQVDPVLLSIHRRQGEAQQDSSNHQAAVRSFDLALAVWERMPEARRPNLTDDINSRLWQSLVAAADVAYDARDWSNAVLYYERAQSMGELPRNQQRRLRQAQREQ